MSTPTTAARRPLGENGWTGGQYSLIRATVGAYLLVHFVHLIPWAGETFSNAGMLPEGAASPLMKLFPSVLLINDSPAFVQLLLAIAGAAAVAFLLGWRDRVAAILMWYVLACLFGRNPMTANPSLPFVGWMLLAHACLPVVPYGSLVARGRVDPAGSWRFPPAIFAGAWVLMALGYSYSGYTKLISPSWVDGSALHHVLENPLARPTWLREFLLSLPAELLQWATWGGLGLELAFAPLAIIRRIRPFIWLAMLMMHVSLMVLIDFADLSFGMVLLHLFTFNPAWIPARRGGRPLEVFFDGHCGLCHGFVRFALAEDRRGGLVFAPLDGETFRDRVSSAGATLPDSLTVLGDDGQLLARSAAVGRVLGALGGLWRVASVVLAAVPRPIADAAYDIVARNRRRLGRPEEACPLLPPGLRARMLP
ncbi:MAG TPA: DCC1-like thiol-disulfide oxidoreductase family protein [Phycisphaerales bacterium]|nr:DCC1-like thiol-disulfide oxidoreductase family protein [Phycisphaerales bacterium]